MKAATEELLKLVSDWKGSFCGAYNIREDGKSVGRLSTEHIKVEPKQDGTGLDIIVAPGTKGEQVAIPACVTVGDFNDLVYNDFYIGEGADVTIVAGCGLHNDTGEAARHNGIHRFFLKKGSHAKYIEKHVGVGKGTGRRSIDPVTEVFLDEDAMLEMDTSQLSGIDTTRRVTKGTCGKGAKLVIHEHLLTEKDQRATTEFEVSLDGEGSSVDLVSRSVAKDDSVQSYRSKIVGKARCTGHSECDAIITGHGKVSASPQLDANNEDAALIHEAAIGKIAGEQILKLRTFGLTEEEAEEKIIQGFLR